MPTARQRRDVQRRRRRRQDVRRHDRWQRRRRFNLVATVAGVLVLAGLVVVCLTVL